MRDTGGTIEMTDLVAALQEQYGVTVAEIVLLDLGEDAAARVYRARTVTGANLFVKVRLNALNPASLLVPCALADAGVPGIIAPRTTRAGTLSVDLAGATLTVQPFVTGQNGVAAGMTAVQWRAFGTILHGVHAALIADDLRALLRNETYTPQDRDGVLAFDATYDEPGGDELRRALSELWRAERGQIHKLLHQTQTLGATLAARGLPQVLCHADCHPWNVMVDDAEQVWLVDWDEVLLAPRERDLMFALGGIGGDGVTAASAAAFLTGYGDTPANGDALAYYRAAWAVSDIGAYTAQALGRFATSDADRRHAITMLHRLFSAEGIVARALPQT